MELRWRYHGLGPIGMALQFRDSPEAEWQNVPIVNELTEDEMEYYRRRQGDGVTIIR